MSDKSAIEWTEATWNTVYGCTKVSPGCANCYIERSFPYRKAGLRFERGRIPVQRLYSRLDLPLRWKRPRMIFVNSLSDTFHEDVPDGYIAQMWQVMAETPQHTYQVLTKRPERMQSFVQEWARSGHGYGWDGLPDVLPNVWLGVTVENQHFADLRIPVLLDTPAAVRFLSCEPLLGPLDVRGWLSPNELEKCVPDPSMIGWRGIDWVIAGGESAGPERRRLVAGPYHIEGHPAYLPTPSKMGWALSLRDQCLDAGVPFFFKQWGGPRPTSGGRRLDGRTWDEMPRREAVPA